MEDRLEEASLEEFPHISVENVMNCSFSAWRTYCSAVTPNARVIRLSDEAFLYYLGQDGLILPPISSKYNEDSENNVEDAILNSVQDNASDCSFSDNSSGDIHINTSDCVAPFRSLDQEITCVIATLGGAVFPKLNWSAPKDAAWITSTRTLRCTTSSDVYLLLKSSDYITHDLYHAFDDCCSPGPPSHFQHELVLKQWFNVHPSMEFRCFVKQRCLIGISQRDLKYYDFLESLRPVILSLSIELFDLYLKDKFLFSYF